jgi:small-conductance mechanosensitive channel
MANITQSAQPKKPKQEGFKWGQELLKAKAIIASLNETIEEQHEMIDELNDDNDALRNQLHRTLTENEELKAEIALLKASSP